MKKCLSILFALAIILGMFAGCSAEGQIAGTLPPDNTTGSNEESSNAAPVEVDYSQTDADMFTERDLKTEYDTNNAIAITLNETTASATSDSVEIRGSTVTIKEEATYVISGELSDGMLVVDCPDTAKLQLVFNGVHITSKASAALYILEADKVFVTLAKGTVNTLINGGSFTAIDGNNIDGTIFSKQDLTLNGSGLLTVDSPAGHGIVCKDDLVITGGSYEVNSASHALDVNDSVRIINAALAVDAGKDAIHAENTDDATKGFVYISSGTVKGEAEGDGIDASGYMQIQEATVDLLVGGGSENGTKASSGNYGGFMGGGFGRMRPGGNQGSVTAEDTVSMKGLKAANSLLISGGSFTINSADDAIHSDVSVIINGGEFSIASGDDAIHAENTLTVTAGKIDISESYEGLEALHIDLQGGDIKLVASDDGLNAAGGTDQSGFTGGRDGMFGGGMGGGRPGGMSSGSNGSIQVSGGSLYINSSGDGMDANGTLEITGGHITVVGPTQGDTATLDYDRTATISGGTFIGTGASGMAQTFSDASQGVIAIRVGNQSAGTKILLTDKNGNTLIEHTPELSFAVVILSSPELSSGEAYTITIGTQSEKIQAN